MNFDRKSSRLRSLVVVRREDLRVRHPNVQQLLAVAELGLAYWLPVDFARLAMRLDARRAMTTLRPVDSTIELAVERVGWPVRRWDCWRAIVANSLPPRLLESRFG